MQLSVNVASNIVDLQALHLKDLQKINLASAGIGRPSSTFKYCPCRKSVFAPLTNTQSAARSFSIPVAGARLEDLRGTSNGSSWIRKAFNAGRSAERNNSKRQETNKGDGAATGFPLKTNASSNDNDGDMSGMAWLAELRYL
jgi:hypothetical protein